jgi:hypothetical protein
MASPFSLRAVLNSSKAAAQEAASAGDMSVLAASLSAETMWPPVQLCLSIT